MSTETSSDARRPGETEDQWLARLAFGKRPVALVHDGVEYKAFPEQGSYFGVTMWKGRQWLLQVPMMADRSPAKNGGEIDPVDVVNMHEPGDAELLDRINAEFGTTFRQSDFPGR